MQVNVKKLSTLAVLLTFLSVGAFGFMFMMHSNDAVPMETCEMGIINTNCPVSLFAHIEAWRGLAFNFAQIFLLFGTIVVLYLVLQKVSISPRTLVEHMVRERFSRMISRIQLLYSILFSNGIIHAKITPDDTY